MSKLKITDYASQDLDPVSSASHSITTSSQSSTSSLQSNSAGENLSGSLRDEAEGDHTSDVESTASGRPDYDDYGGPPRQIREEDYEDGGGGDDEAVKSGQSSGSTPTPSVCSESCERALMSQRDFDSVLKNCARLLAERFLFTDLEKGQS